MKKLRERLKAESELLKMGIALLMAVYLVYDKWSFAAAIRSGTAGTGLVLAYIVVMCWLTAAGVEIEDETV